MGHTVDDLLAKYTMNQIYYIKQLIENHRWEEQRSLALRVVNVFGILVGAMYGSEVEDKDAPPNFRTEQQELETGTVEQQEAAIKKMLSARQTHEQQVESFKSLERMIAARDEKAAKENK